MSIFKRTIDEQLHGIGERLVRTAKAGNTDEAREIMNKFSGFADRALRCASANGHTAIVEKLLQPIVSEDAKGISLYFADREGHGETGDLLFEHGAKKATPDELFADRWGFMPGDAAMFDRPHVAENKGSPESARKSNLEQQIERATKPAEKDDGSDRGASRSL